MQQTSLQKHSETCL